MKRIEEIDPNFRVNDFMPQDYRFLDPREAPFQIYGMVPNDEGSFCRLPLALLPQSNEGVQELAWHLAGTCVRFSTDSSGLGVLWELRDQSNMGYFTACGQSGMELFEETDSGIRQVANLIPQMENGKGCCALQHAFIALKGGLRHYALYLPLYNGVKQFSLGFAPGARVEAGRVPRIAKPLVFYGSSITQGGCASKVGSCYSTILARRLDAAQINLGFSGSARGEESMARYIASLEMSVFIMDYDHNAPSVEHLAATHEPFFRIIRQAQPQLPIVLVSRPDFDKDVAASRQRRDVIVQTYANALAAGDKNVYYVDGEQFFGATDRELCTVDGCHPNDIGFLRMADTMEPILRHILD